MEGLFGKIEIGPSEHSKWWRVLGFVVGLGYSHNGSLLFALVSLRGSILLLFSRLILLLFINKIIVFQKRVHEEICGYGLVLGL